MSVKDTRLDRFCNRHEFRSQLIRSGRWSFRFCKAQRVASSRVHRKHLALVHHGPPEFLCKKMVTSQRSVYDAFGAGHSSTSISVKLRQRSCCALASVSICGKISLAYISEHSNLPSFYCQGAAVGFQTAKDRLQRHMTVHDRCNELAYLQMPVDAFRCLQVWT